MDHRNGVQELSHRLSPILLCNMSYSQVTSLFLLNRSSIQNTNHMEDPLVATALCYQRHLKGRLNSICHLRFPEDCTVFPQENSVLRSSEHLSLYFVVTQKN